MLTPWLRAAAFFTSLVLLMVSLATAAETPRKIILDTDPGTDDALAILLALNSPELDVQAITVVAGNVPQALGTENALKLVSLAGRCDIPVAAGAERPLLQPLTTAEFVHGKNGLGNVNLPPPRCQADSQFAPDVIIELIHQHPGQVTLVPVGPLTNIALAVRKDPSIVRLVKEVILMGGSLSGGNITAAAEFNIYNDPEAAQIVFSAGWPVTMVGLDVTHQTLFTREHLGKLSQTGGRQNDFAVAVLQHLIDFSEDYGFAGTALHDPLAVGVAIDRSVVTTQPMHVAVETRGELTRGETVANRRNLREVTEERDGRTVALGVKKIEPNARICVEVQAERFLQLFLRRLRGK